VTVTQIGIVACGSNPDGCVRHPGNSIACIRSARIAVVDGDRISGLAKPSATRIPAGACAGIATRSTVALGWVGTGPGSRVAAARDVTLIERGTHDRVIADTRTGLASVTLRARIPVGTDRAVGLDRVRTEAGRRAAAASHVTLVEGRADHRASADTRARLTHVRLRASVAVATSRAVTLCRIRADAGAGVAAARVVTLILRITHDRGPGAGARLTAIGLRTRVSVGAGRAIGQWGGRAHAGARVASAGSVTLVGGRTNHRTRAYTGPSLTAVALRTGVSVATGGSVRLLRVRAYPRRRVARADAVTLVLGGAGDRACPDATAGLTRVALGASVAVGAGAAVGLAWVRAHPRGGRTNADAVTLVLRGTYDRVGSHADPSLAAVGGRTGVAIRAS